MIFFLVLGNLVVLFSGPSDLGWTVDRLVINCWSYRNPVVLYLQFEAIVDDVILFEDGHARSLKEKTRTHSLKPLKDKNSWPKFLNKARQMPRFCIQKYNLFYP